MKVLSHWLYDTSTSWGGGCWWHAASHQHSTLSRGCRGDLTPHEPNIVKPPWGILLYHSDTNSGLFRQSLHRAVSWRTCIITSSLPRSPETSRKCFLTVNPTFSCGRLNSLLLDVLQKRWRSTGRYSQDNFIHYQTSLFLYISSSQTFYWRPQKAFVMWVISRGI